MKTIKFEVSESLRYYLEQTCKKHNVNFKCNGSNAGITYYVTLTSDNPDILNRIKKRYDYNA